MKKDSQIGIKLPGELHKQLLEIAANEDRTLCMQILRFIKIGLERYQKDQEKEAKA
jgi:hypothetical protein